jgi:superfamily I DNA/RNA helicase
MSTRFEVLPDNLFEHARAWKVEAGAGCGKTFILRNVIRQLVADGVDPLSIMVMQFNRRPADAFNFMDDGIPKVKKKWWNTSHALALRMLGLSSNNVYEEREWGNAAGFTLSSGKKLIKDGTDTVNDTFGSMCRKVLILAKDSAYTPMERKMRKKMFDLQADGIYTHTGYLFTALSALILPEGVEYVLVDEGQDNSPLHLKWLQNIIDNRPDVKGVLIVGDSNQAIYEFIGGSADGFLSLRVDAEFAMDTTYRMGLNILREANKVIIPIPAYKRSALATKSAQPDHGFVFRANTLQSAVRMLRKGMLEKAWNVVFALCRTKFHIRGVKKVLVEAGIVPDSSDALVLRDLLNAMAAMRVTGTMNEYQARAVSVAYPLFKRGAFVDPSYARVAVSKDIDDIPDNWMQFVLSLRSGTIPVEHLPSYGFTGDFANTILTGSLSASNFSCRSSDLDCARKWINDFPPQQLPVTVSTIHSVKGEEADAVLVLTNITNRVSFSERGFTDHERRVWYVAMTRARYGLILASDDAHRKKTCFLK